MYSFAQKTIEDAFAFLTLYPLTHQMRYDIIFRIEKVTYSRCERSLYDYAESERNNARCPLWQQCSCFYFGPSFFR